MEPGKRPDATLFRRKSHQVTGDSRRGEAGADEVRLVHFWLISHSDHLPTHSLLDVSRALCSHAPHSPASRLRFLCCLPPSSSQGPLTSNMTFIFVSCSSKC